MKKNEILAAIHQMKEQIAVLESLVLAEDSINEVPTTVEEIPVIEEDVEEDITLPEPPAEVQIDIPEDNVPHRRYTDKYCILGCKIINKLPDFYNGKCSVLRLHKQYFDNGQPRLYINKYKVVVIALDSNMQEIGRTVTHWNNLADFHAELSELGINTHYGENWMPKIINLDLD